MKYIRFSVQARKPELVLNNKERIYHLEYFAVLVDQRVKVKESKKSDNYLSLAGEVKKLWKKSWLWY